MAMLAGDLFEILYTVIVEMLAMYHFSWKRTKNMLEGRPRNKTITAKDSKLTVLERICSKAKYQSPCQPNQLWECVTVDRRPRLRKCRRNATAPTKLPTPSTSAITPVKLMCVCMKRRPGTEVNVNQGDMLPYEGECGGNLTELAVFYLNICKAT